MQAVWMSLGSSLSNRVGGAPLRRTKYVVRVFDKGREADPILRLEKGT